MVTQSQVDSSITPGATCTVGAGGTASPLCAKIAKIIRDALMLEVRHFNAVYGRSLVQVLGSFLQRSVQPPIPVWWEKYDEKNEADTEER